MGLDSLESVHEMYQIFPSFDEQMRLKSTDRHWYCKMHRISDSYPTFSPQLSIFKTKNCAVKDIALVISYVER